MRPSKCRIGSQSVHRGGLISLISLFSHKKSNLPRIRQGWLPADRHQRRKKPNFTQFYEIAGLPG